MNKKVVVTNETVEAMMEFITWSLEALAAGTWPEQPPFANLTKRGRCMVGKRLKRSGFLIGCKGDWKWEKELFNQKRHYNASKVCVFCNAGKTDEFPFADFSEAAAWLPTVFSAEAAQEHLHCALCRLFYWTPFMVWTDILHVLFLGTARDFVSSAILMIARSTKGDTIKIRTSRLLAAFRGWCKENRFCTSLGAFNFNGKYPMLAQAKDGPHKHINCYGF